MESKMFGTIAEKVAESISLDSSNLKDVIERASLTCEDIIAVVSDEFWLSKEKSRSRLKLDEFADSNEMKTVLIILESPHIQEYSDINFISPALGKTGDNLQEYFTKQKLEALLGEEFLKPGYKVILMNSIQYQCSLGKTTAVCRDHIWIKCWFEFGKTDFEKRISIYSPDVVFNFCTTGCHKKENKLPSGCKTVFNDIYLRHCLGDNCINEAFGDSLDKNNHYSLQNFVTQSLRNCGISDDKIFIGPHPSSWKYRGNSEKITRLCNVR